jgi:hypothetical protein
VIAVDRTGTVVGRTGVAVGAAPDTCVAVGCGIPFDAAEVAIATTVGTSGTLLVGVGSASLGGSGANVGAAKPGDDVAGTISVGAGGGSATTASATVVTAARAACLTNAGDARATTDCSTTSETGSTGTTATCSTAVEGASA